MTAVIRQSFEVNTEASGSVVLKRDGGIHVNIDTEGAITLDAASAKALSLKQGTVECFGVDTAGKVSVTAAADKALSLRQGTVEFFGVDTAGTVSVTAAAAKAFSLKQGAAERVGFDTDGAITLTAAPDKALSLRQDTAECFGVDTAGAVSVTAAAGNVLNLKQGGVSAFTLTTAGALTLASTLANQNIAITPNGTGKTVIKNVEFSGAISIPQISSESMDVPNDGTTTFSFTVFTDTSGAATIYIEGKGNGTTGTNSCAIFHVCKTAAASIATINTAVSTKGSVSNEEFVLDWPASSPYILTVKLSASVNSGSDTSIVHVVVISASA